MNKLMTLDQAIDLIRDYSTVNLTASGGGMMDAEFTYQAIEKRFLQTGDQKTLPLFTPPVLAAGMRPAWGGCP